MVEIVIAVSAYFLVSRLAHRKGFKGPVPGILAAISFPAGLVLGALLFALTSGSFPYTVQESYLPLVFKERAYAAPVISGLLLLAVTVAYFVFCPRKVPLDHGPRKMRFPFGLLGMVLVAVGILFLLEGGGLLLNMVAFGCFSVAAPCFALSKRRRALSAERLLAKDRRQPVLLLRSFSKDTGLSLPALGFQPPRRLPWSRDRTLEEMLVEPFFRRLGPVIALGNPEDYLPQLGAARTYPSDSDWFEIFQSLAKRAACFLIYPAVSDGLLRELRWIRENIDPARVYLLDPNTASNGSDFLAKMKDAGFEIPTGSPTGVSIWGFTHTWCIYPAARELATPVEYAEAVVHGLTQGPGSSEFRGTARERAERLRASKAYALGKWLATTAHKVSSPLHRRRSNGG